jgi:hypothetical protein
MRDNDLFERLRVCVVAWTTMSTEPSLDAFARKFSRTTRLIRFRSTARGALLRLIASPSRGCWQSLALAVMVKTPLRKRFPVANVCLKSAGLSSLIDFGNGRSGERKTLNQGVRRARPFARLALITRRPALVAIRARKPWRRARFSRLGWNVLFIYRSGLNLCVESVRLR